MREAGDEPRYKEGGHVPSHERKRVAHGKRRHKEDDEATARHLAGKHRDERRADSDAQRVGGDDVAGNVFGNAEVCGNQRQEPHGDKLGNADAETTERDKEQDDAMPPRRDLRLPRQGFTCCKHGFSSFK